MHTHTKESQANLSPQDALTYLVEGNRRFVANLRANRDYLRQVNVTSEGQFPFAVVLSCIDSRTSAELIFDQGLGDIFSARIAGNVLNDDILGSMEFACKLAGSRLIVVLGHTACGAVKGACAGAELGHLTGLLKKIAPVVDEVRASGHADEDSLADTVASHNVHHVVKDIRKRSPILDELITQGSIGIVGGMYSVQTGEVTFQDLVFGA